MESKTEAFDHPSVFQTLDQIAAGNSPAQVVAAMQGYLAAWSCERIERVRTDASEAAPFDQDGRPATFDGVRDLRRVRDAVHRRCMALRSAGGALPPELIELDEVFFIAAQMAESLEAPAYQTRTASVAARSGMFAFV